MSADLDKRAMAELGSKRDNDWLSLVLTVGRVDEWRPSSLVLVQAVWACDTVDEVSLSIDNFQSSSTRGITARSDFCLDSLTALSSVRQLFKLASLRAIRSRRHSTWKESWSRSAGGVYIQDCTHILPTPCWLYSRVLAILIAVSTSSFIWLLGGERRQLLANHRCASTTFPDSPSLFLSLESRSQNFHVHRRNLQLRCHPLLLLLQLADLECLGPDILSAGNVEGCRGCA